MTTGESRLMSYHDFMKLKMTEVLELNRALNTTAMLKNYESWYEYIFKPELEKEQEDSKSKFWLKHPEKEAFRWDTWEIKSAWEYDALYVPTMGNDGWGKIMSNNNLGFLATQRMCK